MIGKSEWFLNGIADYYFINNNKKSKDKRNSPPLWMEFKLHINEWKAGWVYASQQELHPRGQVNKA